MTFITRALLVACALTLGAGSFALADTQTKHGAAMAQSVGIKSGMAEVNLNKPPSQANMMTIHKKAPSMSAMKTVSGGFSFKGKTVKGNSK